VRQRYGRVFGILHFCLHFKPCARINKHVGEQERVEKAFQQRLLLCPRAVIVIEVDPASRAIDETAVPKMMLGRRRA
jgi:hypothetical protein